MTAQQGAVAQLKALVEDLPELVHILVRAQRDIGQVDGHDALVKATIVLGLVRVVVQRVGNVVKPLPDYISEKKMRELKLSKGETAGNGDCYTCMGCRSFLTPDRSGNGFNNVANALNYDPNKPKYYGRFNQGVVTIRRS